MECIINTPLMRQYLNIKKDNSDAIVLFRLGDFYEMFFDDAVIASKILEITLTSRNRGEESNIPMCGVPYHAVQNYIPKLLAEGFKVAVCEQMEDPTKVKGLVKREVVQVITPGVVFDPETLDSRTNNYLVALYKSEQSGDWGISYLDASAGFCKATTVQTVSQLHRELCRVEPKELIISRKDSELLQLQKNISLKTHIEHMEMSQEEDLIKLKEILGEDFDSIFTRGSIEPLALKAAELGLRYIAETQKGSPIPVRRIIPYKLNDYMILDETTQKHLELFKTLNGDKKGSFINSIDYTLTPMGGRLLREWIIYPLTNPEKIKERQNGIEYFVQNSSTRFKIRNLLKSIGDLERLTSRAIVGAATPRDLGAIRDYLAVVPEIMNLKLNEESLLDNSDEKTTKSARNSISSILSDLFDLDFPQNLYDILKKSLVANPPNLSKDGGIFVDGYNSNLDELIELATKGKDYLQELEKKEREKTGISSLKLRYNKVFGYYIEVTNPNLKYVPQYFIRKQTLANAERFITEELQEYETKILGAEEKRKQLEFELFVDLRNEVVKFSTNLFHLASQISKLDICSSIAELSHERGFCKPFVVDSKLLDIKDGRHPVVELNIKSGQFVSNDIFMNENDFFIIVTGPNMSGKSTIMRQVALISLMAQAGLFVPAKCAKIGIIDRIFTRVGASDNLVLGQSTFMTEMQETATILGEATEKSLVILDEIGRGTSTYDGMSIAWAVTEYIHDVIKCRTMFATHYHELTQLADELAGIVNYNVVAQEYGDKVIFLHRLEKGAANKSYGIEVARLAGVPPSVLKRSKEILKKLEEDELKGIKRGKTQKHNEDRQLGLFTLKTQKYSPVVEKLVKIDINKLTPLESLNLIAQLIQEAKESLN